MRSQTCPDWKCCIPGVVERVKELIGIINLVKEIEMSEIVFLVQEAEEGGFTAKALGYSIFTEADTWAELKIEIQDALACHFEDKEKPRLVRLHFTREEIMAV